MTNGAVVRVGAVADLHYTRTSQGVLQPLFEQANRLADLLLLGGDLTDFGLTEEAHVLARDLKTSVKLPVVAVLGNHDFEAGKQAEVGDVLREAGVTVLDGESVVLTTATGTRVGFAGVGGSGGGFWPLEGPDAIHSRALKALAPRARREADRLDAALRQLDADVRVAITHFAPTVSTLGREPLAKYWML